jgi:hypothetical protein
MWVGYQRFGEILPTSSGLNCSKYGASLSSTLLLPVTSLRPFYLLNSSISVYVFAVSSPNIIYIFDLYVMEARGSVVACVFVPQTKRSQVSFPMRSSFSPRPDSRIFLGIKGGRPARNADSLTAICEPIA